MPIEPLSAMRLLEVCTAIIGFLLVTLMGLVSWLFLALRNDMRSLGKKVEEQGLRHARLVHKAECHDVIEGISAHLDRHDERFLDHAARLTRIETRLDMPPCGFGEGRL